MVLDVMKTWVLITSQSKWMGWYPQKSHNRDVKFLGPDLKSLDTDLKVLGSWMSIFSKKWGFQRNRQKPVMDTSKNRGPPTVIF